MNLIKRAILAGVLLSFLAGFACLAAEQGRNQVFIDKLRAKDDKVRLQAENDLLAERAQTVRGLLAILEKPTSPSASWLMSETPENLAIHVLGEMRAVEAIPALVKWAEPPKGGYDVDGDVPEYMSPAGQALAKIGKPADPALIGVLRVSKNDPYWTICLEILKQIEGPKCAAIMVEEAMGKETEALFKENLQAALKKLKEAK